MSTKVKKGFSLLLVFAMMVSVLSGVSIPAKAAEGKGLVSPEIITETTKEIHVSLESIPSMGSLRVIELNPEEAYEEEKLFTGYKSLGAAFVQHSEEKEVTLNLDEAPTPGKKLCVVLRDIEGYGVYKDYILKETIVKSTKKTKDEILNECKVTILKDGEERKDAFAPEEHSVDVSVKLEESIPSCYLTIYAYPGNVTFDPDTTGNIRLGSAYVKDGDKKTINFNDSYKNVKPGYRIISSLNVCLDTETDFYRPSNSKSYEVVDENGEGFQDYDYPDATIDETELEEGTTSLHISLTGDARIFDAAKEGKTNICYSVGMYPEDENFDFEGENQIALVTRQETTEAFSHREVTFDKPLKAGYRVRVVVYWEQNIDIFLPKGNDYEQCFHMPDDSVLVKGSLKPEISLETGIKDNATSIKGMVKGKVPENSMIFVKRYKPGVSEMIQTTGDMLNVVPISAEGEFEAEPNKEVKLETGNLIVAFIIHNGTTIAKSEPVIVQKHYEDDGDHSNEGMQFLNERITTDTTTVTVKISGYDSLKDASLNLTIGDTRSVGDADSRTRLASKRYRGSGVYEFQVKKGSLKPGQNIQLNFYKYDAATDRITYKYSEAIEIEVGVNYELQPGSVEIVTGEIREDREDVWVKTTYDESLTGTFSLYMYEGDTFDENTATQLMTREAGIDTYSSRASFGKNKLKAGWHMIAKLTTSDGKEVLSAVKTITEKPQPKAPTATITSKRVTQGVTYIDTVLGWDESAGEVSYVLYEYEDATFNKETATIVTQGSCSGNCGSRRIYVKDKIHEGHILRLELKADEQVATSNPTNVLPSPNWGTPIISFNSPAIKCDEKTVSLTVDYSDEYEKTFGDEFYCDISIYSIPGGYNDDEIKDKEMWERTDAVRVGQINHSWKKETRGNLTISLYNELEAGNTLIAKLRLPHTEWEGEEEDFLSVSIPIIGAEEEVPQPTVLLYNISKDTSMGGSLYEICKELDVQIKTVSPNDLGETVGYLVGRKGYEKSQEVYSGKVANTQFMLMDGFSDGFMDTFLLSMAKHGVTIDHKAKTTMYNIEWQFHKLVDDIEEEHEEVTTLVALQTLVKEVEKVENPSKELQDALKSAKALLATEEPGTENLKKELEALKEVYLKERNLEELAGDVILKVTPNTDGTYQVSASFDNETEHTLYSWNNGMQGKVIAGVLKEDLKGLVVSLTDSTKHGKIKARFEVPEIPSIGTNATQTEITLSFAQKENKLNAPKVDKIVVVLYDAKGNEVATKESDQLDELHFTGLTAGQTYTVKAWAENVIGRSDKVEVVAATGESTSGGGSYIAPSTPVTPTKADETKENIDDHDTPKNDTPSVVKPTKVKKTAAKAVKHGLKLSWKKVEGATGYEIRYRKAGITKWYTKKVKATEVSLTKLTAKRTYNVKVRAYVTTKVDGKTKTIYGNYSAVQKIKTK